MTPDDLERFGKEIELMFFATGRDTPSVGQIGAYWQTLQDLTWDEFKDGVFNARQKNESGFLPADGVIRAEALKAREFLRARFEKTQRSKALDAVASRIPEEWKSRKPATVAELVESYGKAADLAEANLQQAHREWQRTPPGDPMLGEIIERRLKYRANAAHFAGLQRQYAEMLEHGETEATPAAEERALTRRAKEWEQRS